MAQGMTRIVPTYWPLHFFNSSWNNGPSQAIPKLGKMADAPVQVFHLSVWWVPYLKRLKPEFNNGPEMTSIEATIWTPLHLFKTDLYNGPSLSHGVYICSSLLLMVSWQVPHLSTGSRPNFNNDLGSDSNSGPVLGPGVYLSPT